MWRDEACLLDMLLAARKIRRFSEGVAFEKFLSDELMQHGIMRLISALGASRAVGRGRGETLAPRATTIRPTV
jgi:uncharacterized protein with HEPN domain